MADRQVTRQWQELVEHLLYILSDDDQIDRCMERGSRGSDDGCERVRSIRVRIGDDGEREKWRSNCGEMEILGGFWLRKLIKPAINCALRVLHARMQA